MLSYIRNPFAIIDTGADAIMRNAVETIDHANKDMFESLIDGSLSKKIILRKMTLETVVAIRISITPIRVAKEY